MKKLISALVLAASPVAAEEAVTYDTDQSFDDVIFGLENAIHQPDARRPNQLNAC